MPDVNRESCISYTPGSTLTILREDLLRVTGKNHCAAAILSWLVYSTDCEIKRFRPSKIPRNPWVTFTLKELEEDLVFLYCTKTISAALKDLADKWKLVWVATTPRYEGNRYLLNVEALQAAIDAGGKFGRTSSRPARVVSPGEKTLLSDLRSGEKLPLGSGEKTLLSSGKISPIKECVCAAVSDTEVSEPPLSPVTESEKNEHADEQAEEDSEYLPEAEASERIYNALKSARGYTLPAKTPKAREKIRESLRFNLMGVAVRADRVEPVVERFVEWCRSKRGDDRPPLPTAICHGDWQRLLSGEESLDVDSAPPRRPPASEPAPSRRKPPASEPVPPPNGLPPLAKKWNEIVTAGPKVEVWASKGKDADNLYLSLADEGFTETLDKTLKWCQAVWQAGHSKRDYVTFSWLVKLGTWAEILNGKHEYLLKPEKSDKPKALSIEERLQRAIAFRPESEYKGK